MLDITVQWWSDSALLPVLTLLTILPLAGMFNVLLFDSPRLSGLIGFFSCGMTLLLAFYLLVIYDLDVGGIQFAEHLTLFGLSYSVGVDGANILYLPLVAVVTLLSLVYLQGTRYANDSALIAAILGYETVLLGAFAALNAVQFWLWSALEVLPVAFITGYTSVNQAQHHPLRILLQFWGGGLLMSLIGLILLGLQAEDIGVENRYDWVILAQNTTPYINEPLIFSLLLYGFAVRMPLFPFHAWLPHLMERSPLGVALSFIVGLKLGVYAFIRFMLPLLPGITEEWSALVVVMGIASLFYGVIMAFMALDLRRMLAYVCISQTGIIIVGCMSFEAFGVEGGVLLSLIQGFAGVGLVLAGGFIFERARTAAWPRLGGVLEQNAQVCLLFVLALMTTVGMPGTPGFDAGLMLIEGVVEKNGWLIALALGLGNLSVAAVLLWMLQRLFLVKSARSTKIKLARVSVQTMRQEKWALGVFVLLLAIIGANAQGWQAIVDNASSTIGKYYNLHTTIYEEDNRDNDAQLPAPVEDLQGPSRDQFVEPEPEPGNAPGSSADPEPMPLPVQPGSVNGAVLGG